MLELLLLGPRLRFAFRLGVQLGFCGSFLFRLSLSLALGFRLNIGASFRSSLRGLFHCLIDSRYGRTLRRATGGDERMGRRIGRNIGTADGIAHTDHQHQRDERACPLAHSGLCK